MEIKEISDKEVWENFLLNCQEKTFLQSWNWGEFQKMMGNKIWRLGVYDNNELAAVCLTSLIKAKRGTFLLIQHGPITKHEVASIKYEVLKILLEKLKQIDKEEKADFIRIAPILEKNEENEKIFHDLGFRKSPMHASAYEATWKLDLSPSEDDLLKNMRKTTRYLIRQAQNNPDIVIEKSVKAEDLELYQNLNREVAKRQKFVPFSSEYIEKEFAAFSGDNQAMLFFGKYKNEVAAAALIIFWSGIGFYHQAASDSKYAKLSIPYLLQWAAIKEAKKRGCVFYDFWGYVDPEKNPRHPWAGPTLFKIGFGGRAFAYLKTQDFPISRKYWLILILEKLRKIKRHL
jgi:peptidoglycan pentaglycine glycine transferase (the first glycine)